MPELSYDLVAVGGGTAGLVSAAGAAYLGVRPAIVERKALGGDCLWTGCVPSKALVASARLAHAMRHAEELGLRGVAPAHALARIMERMRRVRARVARHDDPQRFRRMGVEVHLGAARFVAPGLLEVEGVGRIRAKRFVLATGAAPVVPPVPGLEEAGYLTHETVFDRDELPATLVILGGGPVGLELAQVHARLGAQVTVVEVLSRVLPREDGDVAEAVQEFLEAEGIRFRTGRRVLSVERNGLGRSLLLDDGERIEATEILVATGRRPVTEGLGLEVAGVEENEEGPGVRVDAHLRTTARGIWAAGDVTGGLQFTHVADYMAKVALQNALLPLKRKVDYGAVPRVTYTDPEVAHVGLGEEAAAGNGGTTYRFPLDDLDRAIVDGVARGFVKISADRKGRILGATVVARGAGEILMPLVLAKRHGISLAGISDTIFPYPTLVEGVKRAADLYQRSRLEGTGGRILRKVVSWLA